MAGARSLTLVFDDGAVRRIDSTGMETVYQSALRAGLKIMTDCREGACATCKAVCTAGGYDLLDYSEDALSPEEEAEGGVLTCQMRTRTDCVIEFPYPLSAISGTQPAPRTGELVAAEPVARDVIRLALDIGGGVLPFLPGQYVNIEVPGSAARRSYSFANPPGAEGPAEFYVRVLPDGAMSRYLCERARPGDRMEVSGPLGRFFLRGAERPMVMVAGGTGLAPMLSMLEHLRAGGETPPSLTLLYGARTAPELFALDRLRELAGDVRLAVVEPDGWDGTVGHVTTLLEPEMLAEGETDVYLCGPPPMVDAATAWLAQQGHPRRRVHYEKFLPAT